MRSRKIVTLAVAVFALSASLSYGSAVNKKPTEADLKISLEHQAKGNTLDEQGNSSDAIEEYKIALKYDPTDANTIFNMGTVYLKINKPEEAAKAFETVVGMDSRDIEAYNLLGLAYRGCGKKDEAVKAWEKSLSIKPDQALPKKFIEEAKE